MEKAYLDYTQNILQKSLGEGNIGYFLWGAYYNKEMTHSIMRWIIRHQIGIEELRPILRNFMPDFFFPMLLLLHESTELRKVYSEIKLYNNTIKALDDTFGVKGTHKSTFLKILVELSKNFSNITNKKDSKGNYIVNPPISVEVDNENVVESLKHIGNISKRHVIEESTGGDPDAHYITKEVHEEWYIKIKSIHPDVYFFLKNNHHILEKRAKLHAAAGYHL